MRNPCPESAADPIHRALAALLNLGRTLLTRLQTTQAPQPKRPARTQQTPAQRIARTLEWLTALAATLAGDRTWLITPSYVFPRFPGRYPSLTAQLRAECGLPPIPPPTAAQKAAAQRRYMQKIFATQSTAKIARRLARRLGIAEASPAWPDPLLKITQTPVAWAHMVRANARAHPPACIAAPSQAAAPTLPPDPPSIPAHKPP